MNCTLSPFSAVLSKLILLGMAPVDWSGLATMLGALSNIATDPLDINGVTDELKSKMKKDFVRHFSYYFT